MNEQNGIDDASEKPAGEIPRVTPGAPNNIYFMGTMGAGKSTVGWILSRLIGYGFIDTDAEIEKRTRKPVGRIFAEDGEQYFRDQERKLIADLSDIRSHVISLGGGTVADDQCWESIQRLGIGVWLNPPVDEVARRLLSQPEIMVLRPLIGDLVPENDEEKNIRGKGAEKFKTLCTRISALTGMRQPRYKQAKIIVENGFETPEDTAKLVFKMLSDKGVTSSSMQISSDLGSLIRWK